MLCWFASSYSVTQVLAQAVVDLVLAPAMRVVGDQGVFLVIVAPVIWAVGNRQHQWADSIVDEGQSNSLVDLDC